MYKQLDSAAKSSRFLKVVNFNEAFDLDALLLSVTGKFRFGVSRMKRNHLTLEPSQGAKPIPLREFDLEAPRLGVLLAPGNPNRTSWALQLRSLDPASQTA